MDEEMMGHDEGGSGREDTYFLPQGALPEGMKVQSGDVLEFKVVGQDKDGNIEVEYNHGEENPSVNGDQSTWQDEMRKNVGSQGTPGPY